MFDVDPHTENGATNIKRLFFDWSSVVAIALAAMTWAALSSEVSKNTIEIERLRAVNDTRQIADVRIAADMATKADVREVRDQIARLSEQIKAANH